MKQGKIIAIIIVVFSFLNTTAQTTLSVEEVLKKTRDFYQEKDNFKFNTSYKLFNGYKGNKVIESYDGKILKTNDITYSKIHNTEFFQYPNSFLKVNHIEKAMLYSDTSGMNNDSSPISILKRIESSFKSSNILLKGNSYVLEFIAKDLNFLPYKKLLILIDKNDFKIQKQVLFLVNQVTVKDNNDKDILVTPRLEITLFNFSSKKIETSGDSRYKLSNYITKVDNKVAVTAKYKNYNIIQN